jgi:hypothetical protein
MSRDAYEPIGEVTVIRMTDKAILVELHDQDDREVWIPMSVIFEDDLADICQGSIGEINVKRWFYEREIEVD